MIGPGVFFVCAGMLAHFFYQWTCYRVRRAAQDYPDAIDWEDMFFDVNDHEKRRKLTNLCTAGHPPEAARLARIALRLETAAAVLTVIGAVALAIGIAI